MAFNVKISSLAEKQYDAILSYIANKLKNPQALESVMDDYDRTIERLEKEANVFGFCSSNKLRFLGFHKIHFDAHRYLFVYRIVDDTVIVEGLYHELQDYENAII